MSIETLWQDFRHALRLLRLNPGFAFVALLSLALGIGANTAIFQLLDAVRLRMLPIHNPQELAEVRIDSKHGRSGSFINGQAQLTSAQWEQLRAHQQAFSGIFAWARDSFNLARGGEVRNATGLWVSGNFFSVLGVQPVAGRLLTSADDQRGCGLPGAVISYPFWQREFGGDPTAIGRKLSINSHPVEIVGITPANFYGLEVGRSFDIAVPICGQAAISGENSPLDVPYIWWLTAMGRLKPGWSLAQATAQLNTFAPALFRETLPSSFKGERADHYLAFTFKMLPAANGVSQLREDYSTPLWLLLGIAGLVLLIACANLANLMLARASAREREIAVRLAVGASRIRIIRQLLAESMVIAMLGAALGFALAQWLSRFLIAFLSTEGRTLFIDLQPDWPVLAFTAAVATATCILFGLAPALRATRISPQAAMKAGSRGLTAGRERFGLRQLLVVSQVAMSLVLLFGALLFVRTLRNLMTVEAGFRQSGILVTDMDYSQLNIPMQSRLEYKRQILDRIRSLPGIDAAAETAIVPISGNGMNDGVWVSGTERSKGKTTWLNVVSSEYFKTLGIPLLAGRDFNESDTASSPKVAIVNETFAKQLGLGANPLGKMFRREATSREPELDFQIVGLVKDTKYLELREDFHAIAYMPVAQSPRQDTDVQLVVRSSAPFSDLTGRIKTVAAELNPGINITFQNFKTLLGDSLLQERLMATLSGFFGFLAALLATVGLYGVISYMVIRRTNEIGIRMALGADRSGILKMILREAGGLMMIGVVAGALLSVIGARTAKALLYGLKSYDPLTLAVAIALLATVAALASSLPAQRASKLDPMVALREE
jgi:putative ABC transport system permease protein